MSRTRRLLSQDQERQVITVAALENEVLAKVPAQKYKKKKTRDDGGSPEVAPRSAVSELGDAHYSQNLAGKVGLAPPIEQETVEQLAQKVDARLWALTLSMMQKVMTQRRPR